MYVCTLAICLYSECVHEYMYLMCVRYVVYICACRMCVSMRDYVCVVCTLCMYARHVCMCARYVCISVCMYVWYVCVNVCM